jgi:hypothetical protein
MMQLSYTAGHRRVGGRPGRSPMLYSRRSRNDAPTMTQHAPVSPEYMSSVYLYAEQGNMTLEEESLQGNTRNRETPPERLQPSDL